MSLQSQVSSTIKLADNHKKATNNAKSDLSSQRRSTELLPAFRQHLYNGLNLASNDHKGNRKGGKGNLVKFVMRLGFM